MRIALVTYSHLPELSADDRLVVRPLAERGIRAEPAAWDDPGARWDGYDGLVIRSTWNYHTRLAEFHAWIDHVESLGVPTWNPPAVLRWNSDKRYLRDLASAGVEIVPTRWVRRQDGKTLSSTLADAGWTDAVVKPAVSASAFETWRVGAGDITSIDEARFADLTARPGGAMVQRFVPELAREGEWSVMYIGGEYSHAVLKRPRAGDFRVQHEHGGTAEARTPPPRLLDVTSDIVRRVERPLLYARVDGCDVHGRFVLVELELLEPSLFLGAAARAAERFAEQIATRLTTT